MRLIGTHGAGPHRVVMRLAGHALGMGRGFAAAKLCLEVASTSTTPWHRLRSGCPRATRSSASRSGCSRCWARCPRSRRRSRATRALRIPERLAGHALVDGRGARQAPADGVRERPRPARPPAHDRAIPDRAGDAPALRRRAPDLARAARRRPARGATRRTGAGAADAGAAVAPSEPPAAGRRRARRRVRRRRGGTAAAHAATRRAPIGSALLDQRALAGIGNVWRSEVLHAVGVAPAREVRTLDDAELQRIATAAATLMRGPRPRAVYRRTGRPCPRCGTPITSGVVGDDGRRSYWCPACQH